MSKYFRGLFAFFVILGFFFLGNNVKASWAASPNETLHPASIIWGKDRCQRCHMIIHKHYYYTASEIGNPITKKVYKFDSPGCAVLWLYHDHHFKWAQKAKFWIMDARTGKWINMKTAHWYKIPKAASPMHFGLAATDENVKNSFDFQRAKAIIFRVGKMQKGGMNMKNMKKTD